MSQNIAICPTCGTTLTEEHLYGKFLRCSSCANEYLFQKGILSEIATKYYTSTQSWEDFLRAVFDKSLSQLPKDFFTSMHIVYQGELNVPYVDVVDQNHASNLVPTIHSDENSIWNITDIPKQIQSEYYLQNESYETAEMAGTSALHQVSHDLAKTSSEKDDYLYVGREIMYIPMKILKWEYGGQMFCFVGHSDGIVNMGACLPNFQDNDKRQAIEKKAEIVGWFTGLLALALIASAWVFFIHPFITFHGFWSLFVWAKGYKCLFHFIGAFVVIVMGSNIFYLCARSLWIGVFETIYCMTDSARASRRKGEAQQLFRINF